MECQGIIINIQAYLLSFYLLVISTFSDSSGHRWLRGDGSVMSDSRDLLVLKYLTLKTFYFKILLK